MIGLVTGLITGELEAVVNRYYGFHLGWTDSVGPSWRELVKLLVQQMSIT